MEAEKKIYDFEGGEVSIRIEQETIHLKAISGTDPVELTDKSALEIAECLQKIVRSLQAAQ
jgi:hypothetical protein